MLPIDTTSAPRNIEVASYKLTDYATNSGAYKRPTENVLMKQE